MGETSAAPSLPDVERAGIQADHSHMCKFDSDISPGFEKVTEVIQRYSEDSPDIIKSRWKLEKEERTTQRIHKAQEIFPFNAGKTICDGWNMKSLRKVFHILHHALLR